MLAATYWPLFVKGALTVTAALIFFLGSVFFVLSGYVGRRMAYLIEASAFFSWFLLLSLIWCFGFYSQGPTNERYLGPQGTVAHWQPVAGGFQVASSRFGVVDHYPGSPWKAEPGQQTSVSEVASAVQTFMAGEANSAAGINVPTPIPEIDGGPPPAATTGPAPFTTDQFTVQNVEFAVDGHTSLAVAQAFYSGGGPAVTVFLYHDRGNVPVYSFASLFVAILGLAIHVPLLDRAERKRKAWLESDSAERRAA